MRLLYAAALLLWTVPAWAEPCCLVPDNGTGTADLPPHCPPDGYVGSLEILEGLPAGGTLDMVARLTGIAVSSQAPGGSLGGTVEEFTAQMLVEVTGGGTLTGFHRNLVVPCTGITHSAPRTPGSAYQSFHTTLYKLQGILTADHDFNVFWFEGGGYYGLPSPGHTILARQGGPGSDFAVESSFHYAYRIQFDGRQESEWIEGYRGITEDLEADYALCEEGTALGVPDGAGPVLAVSANPFRGSTTVTLGDASGPIVLEVFDSQGKLVRRWSELTGGGAPLVWRGDDAWGRALPGGVYFLKLTTPRETVSRRVVRLP